MLGALDDRHLGVTFAQIVDNGRAVRVHRSLADLRALQERIQDVVEKRLACQRAVILDNGRIVADDKTENILADLPLLRYHGLAPSERC